MNCDNVYKRFLSDVVSSHCVAYKRLRPTDSLRQPIAWLVGMETAQVYTYLNENEMLHMENTHKRLSQ